MRPFSEIDITNKREIIEYLVEHTGNDLISVEKIEDYIIPELFNGDLFDQKLQDIQNKIQNNYRPENFYNTISSVELLNALPLVFKQQSKALQTKQDLILNIQEVKSLEIQVNRLIKILKDLLETQISEELLGITFSSKSDKAKFVEITFDNIKFKADQILRFRQQLEVYLELVDNYLTYVNKYESSLRLKHNKEVHDMFKDRNS